MMTAASHVDVKKGGPCNLILRQFRRAFGMWMMGTRLCTQLMLSQRTHLIRSSRDAANAPTSSHRHRGYCCERSPSWFQ